MTLYSKNGHRKTDLAGYDPKTSHKVWAEIVLCQHESSRRGRANWSKDYLFWKVVKVWPKGANSSQPNPTYGMPWNSNKPRANTNERQSYYAPPDPNNEDRRIVAGRVLITNENMGNKHDERIFFVEGVNAQNPIKCDVTDLQDAWRMRIQSYRGCTP